MERSLEMKLPLLFIGLSLSSQVHCMGAVEEKVLTNVIKARKEEPLNFYLTLKNKSDQELNTIFGRIEKMKKKDKDGNTMMHYCVGKSCSPVLLSKLCTIIDSNVGNQDGRTPMHALVAASALYEEKDDVGDLEKKYKYLMQAGALLCKRDFYGVTPVAMLNRIHNLRRNLPGVNKLKALMDADLVRIGGQPKKAAL